MTCFTPNTKKIAGALVAATLVSSPAWADSTYTLSFGGITDDYLGRTEQFGIVPFDGITFSGKHRFGRVNLDYTVGETFENEAVDSSLIFYDLYFAFSNDNWRVGVGQKERHWSTSEYTSLVLSRNAPAFPSIYLSKERATTTDLPVLRWIGPWDGEIFLGTTDSPGQPDDALFLGMRFVLEPTPNLALEFVRTAQFGGSGQPSGADTFLDVLTFSTNEGINSAANQLAGVGASYRFGNEERGTRFYGQVVGEDEASGRPSCLFFFGGVENTSRLFGANTTLTLEHVDTTTNFSTNGFCGPNSAYNNSTYVYRNEDVVIGAAIGSESRSTVLRGRHEFNTWSLDWNVGNYTINDSSSPTHSLSTSRETGTIVAVGASMDFLDGTLQGVIAHQSFDLDTAEQDNGVRLGINFSRSF